MRNVHESNVGSLLTGIGVGALIAIFVAPKSGRETRRFLRKTAEDGKEYAQRRARELQDRAIAMMDRGRAAIDHEVASISTAVDAGLRALNGDESDGPDVKR